MQFLQLNEELRYLSKKQQLNQRLEEMAKKAGYMMFEPPFFEDYDQFTMMNPRIKKENTVKLINTQGQILLLRPDLTTSIIKHVLPKWNLKELKLSYLSTTFVKGKDGHIEERKQFGIEYLGRAGVDVDRDVILLAASIFENDQLPYLIEINHSRFLEIVIKRMNLTKDDTAELKTQIYYKNQAGINRYLSNRPKSIETDILANLLTLQGSMTDIEQKLALLALDDELKEPLNELSHLIEAIEKVSPKIKLTIDLGLISDYDYYDGIVFMAFLQGTPFPLLKGGRYDSLTKQLGKELPAIGFSLNTTELLKEKLKNEK